MQAARSLIQLGIWIAGILVLLKFLAGAPGYAVVASVLAAAIVAYDVFDAVNWQRPKYLREPTLRRLVAWYVCCLLAMVGIVVAGIGTRGLWWEAVLIVIAFIVVAFARGRIEAETCRRLTVLDIEEGEPLWFKGLREKMEGLVDRFAELGSAEPVGVLQFAARECACRLRSGLYGPIKSARRFVALVAMLASVVLGVWTGLATAERAYKALERPTNPATALSMPARPRARKPSAASLEPASAVPTPESAPGVHLATPLSECTITPGVGAPSWAQQDIFRLYLGGAGVTEAPGTLIAGCPRTYHVMQSQDGPFVYTIGEGTNGQALSLAVDSVRGPALFLTPAVKPALTLIHELGPVGGVRRFSVGGGQFYPVQSDRGTYLLIRAETGTEQVGMPFEVIPPAVTQAWASAIRRSGRFLWPSRSARAGGHTYVFKTSASSSRVAYSFNYQPTGETEPELSSAELLGLAEMPQ